MSLLAPVLAGLLAASAAGAAETAPSASPFAARRAALLARMPAGSVAVLRAPAEPDQSVDPFRQDSDFWYLTGFPDSDAVALLRPGAADGKRYVLFVRPKDFGEEQWSGWRVGVDAARSEHGADDAHPIADFEQRARELLKGAQSLLIRDGGDGAFREALLAAWHRGDADARALRPAADLGPLVHQLRLVKDAAEQALLRRAAALSVEGHRAAMAALRPGRHEYHLKAKIVEACLAGGAARVAYPPIVGSGPNAVVLHYNRDDRRMAAGEMVVNDSGCEYERYASDVTRSYPVSGRFTPEQRAIYQVVLDAQKAGLAKVRPGTSMTELYNTTVEVVVDGLRRLGLLAGERDAIIRQREFRKFYPHGCCHWVGLDVHDAGSYGVPENVERPERYSQSSATLAAGMVLTVEPGIYIPEGSTSDRKWWNIGARIEDTVLVTPGGADCLSCAAPKEIGDLEKALQSN